jgi:cyclopropane fatty-acyl-phospholipid synthase-like methyltransferase
MRALATVTVIATAMSLLVAQDKPAPTPDIHFTPTRHAVVEAMLQLAEVSARDVVYDLGSGDGRIPIIAAQKYGARGVGIEIDARLVEQSRQTAREAGVETRVEFIHGDLFTVDLSRATVVMLYLSPSVHRRLEPKLSKELAPGSRVVSHQFPIPGWTPAVRTRPDYSEIYLYRVPTQ